MGSTNATNGILPQPCKQHRPVRLEPIPVVAPGVAQHAKRKEAPDDNSPFDHMVLQDKNR